MNLFEIVTKYHDFKEIVYDHESGVVDETPLVTLQSFQPSVEKECKELAEYIKTLDKEAENIEFMKQQIRKKENQYKKKVNDMNLYFLDNMDKLGITNIKSSYFAITKCKNPHSVEIIDDKEIPSYYDKIEIKKDVAKIKEDLKNGIDVPGAKLVQKSSIRIR